MYRQLACRAVAALTLSAGLGACTYYGSDVDMAPFDARPSASPLEAGLFCVTVVKDGAQQVEDGVPLIGAGEDCGLIEWDSETRTIVSRDRPGDPDKVDPASDAASGEESKDPVSTMFVRLEDKLYLLQSEDSGESPRYALYTLLASETAMTTINLLAPAEYRLLAKRHPGVVMAERPKAENTGLKSKDEEEDKHPYIVSGSRSDIAALLIEASALSLHKALKKGEDPGFVVRDDGKAAAPHSATPEQARAIRALRDRAAALAARAPSDMVQ